MKSYYRISAVKMISRARVTVAQHDGARMPTGNPDFLPSLSANPDMDRKLREREAREAVRSVPFTIVADEQRLRINRYGRPFIPATTFRGKLRNIAVDTMLAGMSDLSHSVVAALTVGGKIENKASKKRAEEAFIASGMTATQAKEAMSPDKTPLDTYLERDMGIPLLALFGFNNPEFSKGFDSFSILLSKGEFTLQRDGIVRKPPYQDNRSLLDHLSDDGFAEASLEQATQRSDVTEKNARKAAVAAAKKAVVDLRKNGASDAEITNAELDLEIAAQSLQAIEDSADVSASQLHGKWYIPDRVDFSFSLTHRMSSEELGLLIKIIHIFGQSPNLGGDKGRGAGGNFEFEFLVEEYDETVRAYVARGTITNTTIDPKIAYHVENFEKNLPQYQKAIRNLVAK